MNPNKEKAMKKSDEAPMWFVWMCVGVAFWLAVCVLHGLHFASHWVNEHEFKLKWPVEVTGPGDARVLREPRPFSLPTPAIRRVPKFNVGRVVRVKSDASPTKCAGKTMTVRDVTIGETEPLYYFDQCSPPGYWEHELEALP